MNEPEGIRAILESAKTIAVVGCSANPYRASNSVSLYLIENGYDVIPVNPNSEEILGRRCYPSLLDIPRETVIDIVDVFRKSSAVAALVEPSIVRRARFFWMQEGVIDPEAARRLESAGLGVAMDRCIMKERARQIRR